ncbi:hypothetical protein Pcinc_024906 [Petrolisthes cinctipes]|uniref:Hexosyltransferase n=1 Tax=Petrolisthes cinctipes TaxID=88211 RepID=A0AAE1F933_PETCI|nr:hypothetical protein Pcinc_024906 [Petrolisthes cinctipes]
MPRRPRLPTLLAYLLLITLALLLYVSAKGPQQQEGEVRAQEQEGEVLEGGWGAGMEGQGQRKKRRGRSKELPPNPHNYHVMISCSNICTGDDPVWMVVMVSSAPGNFHRRRAIRDTWGGATPLAASHAKLVFLLANPHDSHLLTQVVEESRAHGDILQEDFEDSYLNLTLKTVMGLKWGAQHCPKANYFMKTDDDMFINLPAIMTYLTEAKRERWITGCIKQRKAFRPVNVAPGMPMPPAHPPFVAGAGYVISGDLVRELYQASINTRIIPVEDVYVTAHLARKVGAHPPIHDNRFSCGEMVNDDCDLVQVFTGHRITPERMYHIWDKLNPNGITSSCFDF